MSRAKARIGTPASPGFLAPFRDTNIPVSTTNSSRASRRDLLEHLLYCCAVMFERIEKKTVDLCQIYQLQCILLQLINLQIASVSCVASFSQRAARDPQFFSEEFVQSESPHRDSGVAGFSCALSRYQHTCEYNKFFPSQSSRSSRTSAFTAAQSCSRESRKTVDLCQIYQLQCILLQLINLQIASVSCVARISASALLAIHSFSRKNLSRAKARIGTPASPGFLAPFRDTNIPVSTTNSSRASRRDLLEHLLLLLRSHVRENREKLLTFVRFINCSVSFCN